jgi:hypothetical protein
VTEVPLGKDFDEARAERFARPRTFKMGGKIFTVKVGFRPEVFAEYMDPYYEAIFGPTTKGSELVEIWDETILHFLDDEDGSPARWRELRERHTDTPESGEEADVTSGDMWDLIQWIVEMQTNRRPTQAPSSSGNGRETTGRRSTGRSSSAQVVSEA